MKKNVKTFKTWTNIDVKLMLCGVLPQGRSIHSCRQFCRRHRLKFPGKRLIDNIENLIQRIEERTNNKE